MTDAVIVSTARTPIGKSYRGALNVTEGATLYGHAIGEAVKRAKVDPSEIEDVVMGAAMQQGATGGNIARKALLRAGLPVTTSGTTIDRRPSAFRRSRCCSARCVRHARSRGRRRRVDQPGQTPRNKFHAVDPLLEKIRGVYMR